MKHLFLLPGILLCTLLAAAGARAQQPATPADVRKALAEQPLNFIENRGQWHPDARFLARMNGLDLWVTDQGLVYDLYNMNRDDAGTVQGRSGHVIRMQFLGAGPDAAALGSDPLPGTFNYFIGKDRSRWASNVRRFGRTAIRSIYPGIDAVLYADNGAPRYDLVVAPGSDPSAIRIAYQGATGVRINPAGELVIATSSGDVTQHGLFAYQEVNGRKQQIPCSFAMAHDGTVGFELGAYNRNVPLVIDPIIYSTYYGGTLWDEARSVKVDSSTQNVRIYAAGFTYSTNLPMFTGTYQTNYAGDAGGAPPGGDAFVVRFDPQQSPPNQVVWATYLGSEGDDAATDMTVDINGNVFITGVAGTEFPITTNVASVGSRGVFVSKLNNFGAALLYSTFVADAAGASVPRMVVDAAGRVHVVGTTTSPNLPTSSSPFQSAYAGGGGDAFVAVLSTDGANMVYATYLGGTSNDAATAITLSTSGEIYVSGRTESVNFPLRRNLAYDTTHNGGPDLFVTRLDRVQSGTAQLIYSSYIGGTGYESPTDITIDATGYVLLAGTTTSANFPVRNAFQSNYRGGADNVGDAFLMKLNLGVTPPSQIVYSTYMGGTGPDIIQDLLTSRDGLYLTGWTGSAGFPITINALDTAFGGDSSDVFVAKVSDNGTILYSTFLGGNGGDKGYGIALGRQQSIFVTGSTVSRNFPVSTSPFQSTVRSETRPDMFITHFTILELTSPGGGTSLCAGAPHTITWNGFAGTSYDIYLSSDSGATYNLLAPGVTGNSHTWQIPEDFPSGTGYRIKIVVANGAEYDLTDSLFAINTRPVVTRSPQNVMQVEGGSVTFMADATGIPVPTVQWQFNSGAGWTTIQGETQKTLTVSNITAGLHQRQYRALFTNSCGTVITEPAVLRVSAVLVTSPNGGEEFCAGTTQTLTWAAQSTAGPFDIFLSSNAGVDYNSIVTGVTGTSYNWAIPANLAGTNFRIQVRIGNAQAVDASDSNFTINTPGVVLRNPVSVEAAQGSTASFVADGNGFPFPSVRWEVNPGSGWVPVEGVVVNALVLQNVQMAMNGNLYRAIFTNECGADTTTEAMLTVTPPASVGGEHGAGALRLALVPNPLVGEGAIRFTLPQAGGVELTITDLRGTVVAIPLQALLGAGDHMVPFDASALPSGTYVVGITAGRERQTLKMTITR